MKQQVIHYKKSLVSFFCEEKKEVAVRHLVSLNMPSVTTDDIYNALVSLFDEKKIPWEHCLASLMHSCNVKRGGKKNLEKKLRKTVCPNLLEINGDSCHHIHNSCKVFTEMFGKHLETLFQSIYNDFKWSDNHRNISKDIWFQLGLTYRRPEMYSLTRWLKIYNIAIQMDYIFDVLAKFSHAFLSKSDQTLYKNWIENMERKCSVSVEEGNAIKQSLQPLKINVSLKLGRKERKW